MDNFRRRQNQLFPEMYVIIGCLWSSGLFCVHVYNGIYNWIQRSKKNRIKTNYINVEKHHEDGPGEFEGGSKVWM